MKKKIYIKGMYCVACEKLLEDELSKVPFVKKVKVSVKKSEAELEYGKQEPNSLAIKKIVESLGYGVLEKPEEETKSEKNILKLNWKEWLGALAIVFVFLIFLRMLQSSGVIPSQAVDNASLSFGLSFMIGLVASISSCLAVVGGVVVAFSEKYKSEKKGFLSGALKPNLFFHLGRVLTFIILGGLLGALGGELNVSGNFVAFYTILIAAVMFVLGLNILGAPLSVSKFGISMPKKLTAKWSRLKDSNHKAAPFALGFLSFFLPCGFTQSMQIFALASGSFWTGALVLGFFALGTLPVLLALGVAVSWTKNRHLGVFKKAAGILVLFFAIYTFSSGAAVYGVKGNIFETDPKTSKTEDVSSEEKPASVDSSSFQTVKMAVTDTGFSPSVIKVKKGVPVRWVIDGKNITGCTNRVIIPSLNISQTLSSKETVVEFTPEKSGEIPFSCWMGMVRGKFIVG